MRHVGMLGAVGETLALLGIGLLWTYRAQAVVWLRELLDIWRGEISGRDPHLSDPALPEGKAPAAARRACALQRHGAAFHWTDSFPHRSYILACGTGTLACAGL